MAGKLSELTAASTLTGSELVEVTQGGNTRRTTTAAIAALASSGGTTVSIVTDTATARALQITDPGKVIRRGNGGQMDDVVPLHSTTEIPVESVISVRQIAAGQVVMTPASGVTLNVPSGHVAATRAQGSTIMLHKVGTNEWDVTGDLASA